MLHLHPANHPPQDFAGLRRSLALAWPRHTGHTPLVKDSNSVVWWRKPSAMRACVLLAYAVRTYVTYINDHGFLIIRCVRSPGAIASCRGQEDYCSVPNPTKKKQSPRNWKIWALWSEFGSYFFEADCFLDRGI